MQDTEIVELYWQRSDQAIPETELKYGRYCHRIAYNICQSHEDAEECVNDTWLSAWNAMPDARPSALAAFLGTISRNLALDRFRLRSRGKRGGGEVPLVLEELAACVPAETDVERQVEEKELIRAINRFLSTLKAEDRKLFVARYWYLAPIAELAQKSGSTQGRIKMKLYRMRNALADDLQKEGLC